MPIINNTITFSNPIEISSGTTTSINTEGWFISNNLLSGNVTISGTTSSSVTIGTSSPTFIFGDDVGFYEASDNNLSLVAGGTEMFRYNVEYTLDQKRDRGLVPDYRPRSKRIKNY